MGWFTSFITTPTTRRLSSQHLDPALSKLFWFTPTFPTCPTIAELFLDIKRPQKVILMWLISPPLQSVSQQHLLFQLIVHLFQVWFLCYVWSCLRAYQLK
ncbi:hypothetical protein Goshw_003532 [Gossypium schwendimanii]|uniref:Uncharacterized protein ycf72 n=1 Tax=Gossypium schwendimanii TaxID=34291 RepID=A0A7J9MFE6_GOSSC|nr:hypothetical protein [Gossypium schwendimanii]